MTDWDVLMEYTVELYEDPDRYSRWDVIEWREEYDPLADNVSRYGAVIHSVRGNDWNAELMAHEWLNEHLKEMA